MSKPKLDSEKMAHMILVASLADVVRQSGPPETPDGATGIQVRMFDIEDGIYIDWSRVGTKTADGVEWIENFPDVFRTELAARIDKGKRSGMVSFETTDPESILADSGTDAVVLFYAVTDTTPPKFTAEEKARAKGAALAGAISLLR